MKLRSLVILLLTAMTTIQLNAQDYFDGKFSKKNYTHLGHSYTLYDFSREGNTIKAKYFAQNAYSQYLSWKSNKTILLVTAGAFSDKMEADAKPVGLCVDNGVIVNREPDNVMDGMVIIYNGGAQQGGVAVVDMDYKPVKVDSSGKQVSYYPRTSFIDRYNFLKWGESNNVTLFQTQLVYSSDRYTNFSNPTYGAKRERRFLATCKKGSVVHHVVIDGPESIELNLSASYAKSILEFAGFNVLYIMNLDTGDKNVLYAYNGSYLQNLYPYKGDKPDRAKIENATNLLVYYKD